jgi:hypothetical protein
MVRAKRSSGLLTLALVFVMGMVVTGHAMDVTLGWDANTETDLAGYKVYYGTTQGGPYNGSGSSDGASPVTVLLSGLFNPNNPEFTVHGLSDGKYYFVVTAFNTDGLESGYSNEAYTDSSSVPSSSPGNASPVLSDLHVNGQSGNAFVYTSNPTVIVQVVASDDGLVSEYLLLDGVGSPAGHPFTPIPGGPRQNAIFTVGDFVLNDDDANRTVYAWVKDDQGLLSAAATKSNVVLDRVAPTVAISFSKPNPVRGGESITVTANFTDANPISGNPKISIDYAGDGSDVSGAAMNEANNKQWTYRTTIPVGNSGPAVVTVSASDAAGNPVGAHTGNTFVVDDSAPAMSQRVTDGLVVLYDFGEGSGTTVHDMSGIGEALDLNISNGAAVSWIAGGGLAVHSPTVIRSAASAGKVITALKASNALTVEAWVKPAGTDQSGPARIVSCSSSPTTTANFMLGAGLWGNRPTDVIDVRLFGKDLSTPAGTLSGTGLRHVVFSRDAGGAVRVYIDGVERYSGTVSGSFSTWNSGYPLLLGNEATGDRPWLGEFHLVAIYDRALSKDEVVFNLDAGLVLAPPPSPVDDNDGNTVDQDAPVVVDPDGQSAYAEDFEGYPAGEDPVDWLDTAANNSMFDDQRLFKVFDIGGEKVFGTTSTLTNIHSHYLARAPILFQPTSTRAG